MTCTSCTERTRSETQPVIIVGAMLGIGLLCYVAFYKRSGGK